MKLPDLERWLAGGSSQEGLNFAPVWSILPLFGAKIDRSRGDPCDQVIDARCQLDARCTLMRAAELMRAAL